MNNSINYSGFVEMCLNSSDDYEPYGCADVPVCASESGETPTFHVPDSTQIKTDE